MGKLTHVVVGLIGFFVLALAVTGCSGGGSSTQGPPPPPPPPNTTAATLTASPATITAGQFSTLTWTSTNATSVTINPAIPQEDVTNMPLNGQGSVTPAQTTTYTFTATGTNGTATATATVTVNQVPPTVTLTASPTAVTSGGSTTLTWSTSNATSLTIDNNIGSVSPVSGSLTTQVKATTTFTATATGPGGTATATATVAVSPVTVTLTANPDTISSGGTSTLTWTANDANTVVIDQGVGTVCGAPPCTTGTVPVSPTKTTTYTATATDPSGVTTTAKAVVTISGALQQSINHIIWLVQENRSFDSYFGKLGLYRVNHNPPLPEEINGVDNDMNPAFTLKDLNGNPVHPFHYQTECTDNLTPAWNESHFDVDPPSGGTNQQGKMDNFLQTTTSVPHPNDSNGSRAMGYYTQADLPYYYELATQFAVSDSMFSPVLANTIPNRLYLFTGTSFGTIYPGNNPSTGQPEFNPDSYKQKTIFDVLNANNISWKYYFQDNSIFLASFSDWTNSDGTPNTAIQGHVFPISDYFNILGMPNADQLLPQVVFIERGGDKAATDEHPLNNVQVGAAAVAQMINTLMASSAWPDSVFILAFDEGGGLYDHVPPIKVIAPDTQQPQSTNVPFKVLPGDFTDSGFRVPFVVVSPWVKPNYVSHVPSDTTSILKFIETRFNLPNLTARDGSTAANVPPGTNPVSDLTDFFDFSSPHLLTPPTLPTQPTTGACSPSMETGP